MDETKKKDICQLHKNIRKALYILSDPTIKCLDDDAELSKKSDDVFKQLWFLEMSIREKIG